jgi:predicted metal-dependent hydrolase
VSVGDAGSRWGSCSSQGRIRLSWRLILAPPDVRRYVVAHEVAHLRHLNHGAEFKALEARLFGAGVAAAKAELRRLGPRLRRLGRRS